MGRVRKRGYEDSNVRDQLGTIIQYGTGGVLVSKTKTYSSPYFANAEVCKDEIHPRAPYEGGPFSLTRYRCSWNDGYAYTGAEGYRGRGTFYDCYRRAQLTTLFGYPTENFVSSCESHGPDAWNRFKPRTSTVNLAQFLAELRDFPKLFKFKVGKFKDLGSDYLNYQFGWRPFLSDLRRWYNSIIRIDRQLAELQKRNGKWIRRGGTLLETTDRDEYVNNGVILYPNNCCSGTTTFRSIETYEKVWFAGAFRFYIPGLSDGSWGRLRKVSQLWGLDVSPALVWEILPWSWLADWFSNVGSVISNYTSITSDNLAAKYAYVMRHTKVTSSASAEFYGDYYPFNRPVIRTKTRSSSEITIESKTRAVASPYGFNLSWADFNPFQVSILAALGLSRY